MKNDFENLYDDIVELTDSIREYCLNKLMTAPTEQETDNGERYRELLAASDTLHDVAHELEEHLAWD